MIHKPRFSGRFHVGVIEQEGVLLADGRMYTILGSEVCEHLAPLLDGRHTVDEIVDALEPVVPRATAYYALQLLEHKRYITEAAPQALPSVGLAETRTRPSASARPFHHQAGALRLTVLGGVPVGRLLDMLEQWGERRGREHALHVVVTPDYLDDALDALNQEALASNTPLLLVKPTAPTAWIGPLLIPGRTGCWACLAQRLRANCPAEVFLRSLHEDEESPHFLRPSDFVLSPLALDYAWAEVAHWLAEGDMTGPLVGRLLCCDFPAHTHSFHQLTRRPQCPHCGNDSLGAAQPPSPLTLQSRTKRFTADGGHRIVAPEDTFAAYRHHISPITGVIRSLERIDDETGPDIYAYKARHSTCLQAYSMAYLRRHLSDRSGGKGRTWQQARTSALCEALERYSGVFQGDEQRYQDAYSALRGSAIHPAACLQFSADQYADRDRWNAISPHPCHKVAEPFDEDAEIEWTPLWSLTHQTFKLLPTAYCYFGYPGPGSQSCPADSNGNAAGNTLEEAILQGFMELVERDSVALWWYNRVRRPKVDLSSFDDPYFEAMKTAYEAMQRDLWVLDVTSDLNIPAVVAVSRRRGASSEGIIMGFGTHFDPRMAVSRALTELNQVLPEVSAADEPASEAAVAGSLMDWWQTATLENQPYLVPDPHTTPKRMQHYAYQARADLLDDVLACVEIARAHGLEVLVLDQTRPDVGLNVVKVVVPGLCHFWRRLGSRRIYEVPFRLGWVPTPLEESQLNPIPLSY